MSSVTLEGVPGAMVNFSVVSGDGTLSSISATADGTGVAAVTFTAGTTDSQVNGWDSSGYGASGNFTFAVGASSGGDSYNLALSADSSTLQPGQTSNLCAQLTDNGIPISGALIAFTTQFGDGSLGSSSAVTDGNGMAIISFTGGYNRTQVNVADQNGYGTSNSYTFGVDTSGADNGGGGSSPASDSYALGMWADTNPLDPGSASNLYAQLVDTTSQAVVTGATINFSVASGDGTLSSYSATTDNYGMATVVFQGGWNATQVNAADQNGYGTANSFLFGVTSTDAGSTPSSDNYILALSADQSTLSPGQTSNLSANLVDNGVPMAGVTLNFSIASGDGSLSSSMSTTDGNGNCVVTYTSGNSQTVVNAWDGNGYGASSSYTFGVVTGNAPVDSYGISMWSGGNPVLPGSTANLTAQLTDASANNTPVAGATINFTVAYGDGTVSSSGTTDASGNCLGGLLRWQQRNHGDRQRRQRLRCFPELRL